MAVQFVIGRAGTGKTQHCLRSIAQELVREPLGPPIYWLLPRQATFLAERQLACTAGLSGFCRARVLSFEQFGAQILEECGGAALPQITSRGRQMILGLLLRRHARELRFFQQVAQYPALARQLDATFTELDRCGCSLQELQNLIDQPADGSDPLQAKLHDLLLLHRLYRQYTGQERIDPQQRTRKIIDALSHAPSVQGACVYVDGFFDFDDPQRRILARLGRLSRRVVITLLLDPESPVLRDPAEAPDDLSLFHRTEETYRQLRAAMEQEQVRIDPPLLLPESKRFATEELRRVEKFLFADRLHISDQPAEHLELVEAPDRRLEAHHAAARIRELVGQGLRFREIAVLTRQLDLYLDPLSSSLAEHEIPYFVDARRLSLHHPLLHIVHAVVAIAEHGWPHEAVMTLIKSGLGGLAPEEADLLENYVLEHHLRGAAWEQETLWQAEPARPADSSPLLENSLKQTCCIPDLRRRLVQAVAPFIAAVRAAGPSLNVRQIVGWIYELFSRLGVRETLWQWIEQARSSGRHEQADEHEQVWTELASFFDEMIDVAGQETVSLEDFRNILESGLGGFDLALAPPTVDQVLVGQLDRTRPADVRVVLLLGLNDGVFPAAHYETSILSDADRVQLRHRGFELEAGSERRLLDEPFLAYFALTRASQGLYISRSLSDDAGRPMGPSSFWLRLRQRFPQARVHLLPRQDAFEPQQISTARQLVVRLMQWARAGAEVARQPAWACLYQHLARHPCNGDALDRARHMAWRALSYDNQADTLESAPELFGVPLRCDAQQLETFAQCPFQHFARYGLGLEPRNEEPLPSIRLNHAFRQTLQQLIQRMLRDRRDWEGLNPADIDQQVQHYTQWIAAGLQGELMLANARNRHLLDWIRQMLMYLIESEQAFARRSQLRTAYAALHFGLEGDPLPPLVIRTPRGTDLHLSGHIDRVDVLEKEAAFAIFEYRLTQQRLSLERVYHGLSLQLLIAMLVMQRHGRHLTGTDLAPAAALYTRLLRQIEDAAHPSDFPSPQDQQFKLGQPRRGIVNTAYFRQVDSTESPGRSQVIAAHVNKDGSFGRKDSSDVADPEEISALLKHVARQVARLGDDILSGRIEIRPYRIGTESACVECAYRSVCRFEPGRNLYRQMPRIPRTEVLRRVLEDTGLDP